MRNVVNNGCPLCGTGVEDSPLAMESSRVGEGASGTASAFGHDLLQKSLDGQASGGQGAFCPLHPLTRVPLDPVFGDSRWTVRFLYPLS